MIFYIKYKIACFMNKHTCFENKKCPIKLINMFKVNVQYFCFCNFRSNNFLFIYDETYKVNSTFGTKQLPD